MHICNDNKQLFHLYNRYSIPTPNSNIIQFIDTMSDILVKISYLPCYLLGDIKNIGFLIVISKPNDSRTAWAQILVCLWSVSPLERRKQQLRSIMGLLITTMYMTSFYREAWLLTSQITTSYFMVRIKSVPAMISYSFSYRALSLDALKKISMWNEYSCIMYFMSSGCWSIYQNGYNNFNLISIVRKFLQTFKLS